MATDGVRYSDFSPLPADDLSGDEKFVGLKDGVNVRLEGDWRGPMADLLRPSLMGTAPANIDADGYSNVSFLSTSGTGVVSADRNNAAFLGNDGLVTITLDAAAGRVEAQELMIGGELILFPQNNLTATVNPGVNDDSSEGYSVLSKWLNTTDGEVFVCVDATDGAAVWQQTTVDADDLGSLAFINGSTVGLNLAQISTPGDASWARVNSDGTVSLRTAAQTLSDLGASSGDGNQVVTSPTDTTLGRVTNVGWMGQGLAITLSSSDDLLALPELTVNASNAEYYWNAISAPSNGPAGVSSGYLKRYYQSSNFEHLDLVDRNNEKRYQQWKIGGTWGGWEEVGSGGGGGGGGDATGPYSIVPAVELSANDQDGSGNIAVTLDLSEGTVWTIDCTNSPLMSTSGNINVTVTGLPEEPNTGITFQVYFKQAGRKGINWTLPAGVTASWAGTQSYGSLASSVDVVQGYWLSTDPSRMNFSIIDKR